MKTTDAYRASKVLLASSPPARAAARVPMTTTASGRVARRVRMSRSMWRRSVAIPNTPSPARAKIMRARARPELEPPPANEDTALTMEAKVAVVAHGVPVCRVWNQKVGSHGRKVRQPTTAATKEALAPARHSGLPRHASHNSHSMTVPTR